MASTFTLKANDTRPIFEVVLKNPDGTVHDLTGSTGWKLRVRTTTGGSFFERDMVVQGETTAGTLRYTWVADDWDEESVNPGGSLPQVSEGYPLAEYPMEYEVSGGTSILTFPNDGYDYLRIAKDIA